uniref:Uncharacterized protein n=1 Tax=Candidatus Kentrum eta TaxID=2126337 RepID=A0A450VPS0_9GAMM|nr:MAG: hypothetical protein BECKH772A_GA0070896_106711 [Candidatus Kentron sp. H]VFK09970.1 MAG: hypothetical protein BECKH772C_GA0070978_106651 [Candidatus Kentron sp. H]
MIYPSAMLKCAKGMFNDGSTFFHHIRILFHACFVSFHDIFIYPTAYLPEFGFISQAL